MNKFAIALGGAVIVIVLLAVYLYCQTGNFDTQVPLVGNGEEKTHLIRVDYPKPNQLIRSPLVIRGEARGHWFFEADFPVFLHDADGNEVAQAIMTAQDEWMTAEFVPFVGEMIFLSPESRQGALILRKDNPSGLPEHDDSLIIPVRFR